jgi:MOSC domain-containing protein YiiM
MLMSHILSIAYSAERGLPRPLRPRARLRAGHGIEGDHKAGKSPERALNLIDAERLAELRAAGYDVTPGRLGESVVVEGAALDRLPAGTRLRLGPQAVVQIVKARTPCENLAYIHPDLPAAAGGRVGVMCAVETGGDIEVGDEVVVLTSS